MQVVRIFFIVPPEVHLLDIGGPIQVFYEAIKYKAPIELRFLSLDSETEKRSSAGISLSNLEEYSDQKVRKGDIIFIPGLDAKLVLSDGFHANISKFYQWLRLQYEEGAKICSVCTGAYLSAYSGLLNEKECTTHWKYLDDFQKRFPKIRLHRDRLFVKDGLCYSSAGVSSGIDLSLFILEELFGPIFTTKIAKETVIYLRRTEDDPQLSVFLQYRNHIENRIHKVQDHLAQHLNQKQKIDSLAELVNMSSRNLTRLFKKTTGITIGKYHDKLRIEHAIQLLADGQKVESASHACGLGSNQLRELLRKYTDKLPSNFVLILCTVVLLSIIRA